MRVERWRKCRKFQVWKNEPGEENELGVSIRGRPKWANQKGITGKLESELLTVAIHAIEGHEIEWKASVVEVADKS